MNDKPLLRGHFHQSAFFFACGACLVLVAFTRTPEAFTATLIYSFCLAGLFGISALYHRPQWSPKGRAMMKRLDHSAIFLLIAGTGTPICLLGIPDTGGTKLLLLFWCAAAVGVLQSLLWTTAPKWLTSLFYIGMGWLALPYFPALLEGLGTAGAAMVLSGGIIYTIGALVYAFKWPDPLPRVFGYHEVFHILVVIAAMLHFLVIVRLVNA